MIKWLQRVDQARKIRHDWLGEGGLPVPTDQAQARAEICKTCPRNYSGPWLWNMASMLAINSQMQLREAMAIKLAGEEQLHVCEICGCQLKLKVHVPFHHIYRHTNDETFGKYPEFCWQKKELAEMKGQV